MRLKTKTLLTISITLAGLIGVMYAVSSNILLGSLEKAEEEGTRQTLTGVLNIFTNTEDGFSTRFEDWSAWDDTYKFIEDKNPGYIKSNLSQIPTLKVNVFVLINPNAKIIYGTGFDIKKQQNLPIPPQLNAHINAKDFLLTHPNNTNNITGILMLGTKPMIINSRPIVKSDNTGAIRGSLITGRYLDDDQIKKLEQIIRLPLKVAALNNSQLPADFQEAKTHLSEANPLWIKPVDKESIMGYALKKDIYGKPALIMAVKLKRDIYQQGQKSQNYLIIALLIVGAVFGAVTLALLERLVLARLAQLSNDVRCIGSNVDLSMRVSVSGNDELSTLAGSINWMLNTLEKSQEELKIEREKSEKLLLNILPSAIANRLKQDEGSIADNFPEATVLFADIVGFTNISGSISPASLVHLLNKIFSLFDKLAEKHGLEKIKTIGDAYMIVGGIPIHRPDHAEAIAEMALDMLNAIAYFNQENQQDFNIRIGINTGPVVAGVIGTKKFIYDLWGDTVNIASRMESHGIPGCVQMSESTYLKVKDKFVIERRGMVYVKGKGEMATYLLLDRKPSPVLVSPK
jgi:adenylate cyclase